MHKSVTLPPEFCLTELRAWKEQNEKNHGIMQETKQIL